MSEGATVIDLTTAAGRRVVGYVEAITEEAAFGWAWSPGGDERLPIEIRLDGMSVAEGAADQPRDDLAQGGIGDGRHAFKIPVPTEVRARLADIEVVAYGVQGEPIRLERASQAPAQSDASFAELRRGIDTLLNSQRLMHRNLQAALLQPAAATKAALAEIGNRQNDMVETTRTLELFVARLEAILATADRKGSEPPNRRPLFSMAFSIAALLLSCICLLRVMVVQ